MYHFNLFIIEQKDTKFNLIDNSLQVTNLGNWAVLYNGNWAMLYNSWNHYLSICLHASVLKSGAGF